LFGAFENLSATSFGGTEAMIVCLERKNQSKHINYAKQSQFSKKSSIYNPNSNNELQRKNEIGHLVKTNPNEPNLVPSAVEGSIKTTKGTLFNPDSMRGQ
jgi:hypothetical protein